MKTEDAIKAEAAVPPMAGLAAELVRDIVLHAHGNLDRVKELLQQEPALANAAWDWGGGDWETALGSASHMGRRDIAEVLLAHGARMDIFAAAMLGDEAVVRAMLHAHPDMIHGLGPHGIPFLAHAQAGGANAASVFELIEGWEPKPS